MITLKKIDFDSAVELYSLSDFRDNILNQDNDATINLSKTELKNVLAVVSLQQINNNYVHNNKDETKLFSLIINGESDFLNNNRDYIIKMIDELDQCYKEEFNDLLNNSYLKSELFENDNLKDFCSEAIVGTISTERLWEFGLYNVHSISKNIFKGLSINNKLKFIGVKINSEHLSKDVIEYLKNLNKDFSKQEIITMMYAFQYKFNKENFSMQKAVNYGKEVLQDNFDYLNVAYDLKTIVNDMATSIVNKDRGNERDNNLNNERGW